MNFFVGVAVGFIIGCFVTVLMLAIFGGNKVEEE